MDAQTDTDNGDEMPVAARVSTISATTSKSFGDALKQRIARANKTLRNGTACRGLGRLDEDRANSMTDEGGPKEGHPDSLRADRKDMGLTLVDEKRACAMADEVAAARTALEESEGQHGPARAARAAIWYWDLASGRVEWDERLKALFGYADLVTDAAWRENRIHPEDRDRVKASLQRATIVNHGVVWSDQHRFRQADGSYTTVTERAYVVHDDAGPRGVLGAITPTSAAVDGTLARTEEVP